MRDFLITPIEYLKGVGPQRADLLKKEIGIYTFGDLLTYYPFRYVDKSVFHKIRDLSTVESQVQVKGRIIRLVDSGVGRNKRLHAKFQDETGEIDLVWFKGAKWIKSSLELNKEVVVYGRATKFKSRWNIPHPEISPYNHNENIGFEAVYSSTEKLSSAGLSSKGIGKIIKNLFDQLQGQFEDVIPLSMRERNKLMNRNTAMRVVHHPKNINDARHASFTLKYEELFLLQLELLARKSITTQKSSGAVFSSVGDSFNSFYKDHIPFELTGAQKRVLKEIRRDLSTGKHMNRLLQGDVGSGKTLVALLAMLLAKDNAFQSALMAPTEILANQHFESISGMLMGMDIRLELLTGSTKKKDRDRIHEGLEDGSVDFLIGTHALLEDKVRFNNLGLTVIDEQHRFGVAQKSKMWKKNDVPPHILIMTATPIPRTLAMTFYGDLDVSVIDELPPGRKPISTMHKYDSSRLRLFGFLKEEIAKGRQIYIVYPLINESATLDFNNLLDGYVDS
jgi:ATP-dependent DNA helicase RecG